MGRPTLTVATITLNEEEELPAFIENFSHIADEIVIIDDGSTDRTAEIARQAGRNVRFIVSPRGPEGGYCDQRNKAVEAATSDWILQVDADMRLPRAAADEIIAAIQNPAFDAYRFGLQQYFLNRPARFGGRQYWNQPWLVRCEKARWEQKVHERIQIDTTPQRIGQLAHPLWHINDQTWEQRMRKSVEYSILERARIVEKGLPVRWYHFLTRPTWAAFKTYVLMRGYRDGVLGLILALHTFSAVFHWQALVWDERNRISRDELEKAIRAQYAQQSVAMQRGSVRAETGGNAK